MIQEVETLLQRLHQQDVDVCCRFTPENLRRLEDAVRDLHPVHRQTSQKLPFILDDRLSRELKNIYLRTDIGVIDCLRAVAGIGDYDAVQQASVPVTLPFGECRMLSLDALILSKETMGREHDLAALRQLRAIKERADE